MSEVSREEFEALKKKVEEQGKLLDKLNEFMEKAKVILDKLPVEKIKGMATGLLNKIGKKEKKEEAKDQPK